jgi:hypothetical protein
MDIKHFRPAFPASAAWSVPAGFFFVAERFHRTGSAGVTVTDYFDAGFVA